MAWYRWSWFIAPLSGAPELTSLADVRMRALIRAREMGPDGLPVCQSRDGCCADTIAVNSITVTLCFYPEALGVCWHILVWASARMYLFQLPVTDKLSDGIVLSVMYCSLTPLMPSATNLEESGKGSRWRKRIRSHSSACRQILLMMGWCSENALLGLAAKQEDELHWISDECYSHCKIPLPSYL